MVSTQKILESPDFIVWRIVPPEEKVLCPKCGQLVYIKYQVERKGGDSFKEFYDCDRCGIVFGQDFQGTLKQFFRRLIDTEGKMS